MLRDIASLSASDINGLIDFLSSFRSKERVEQLRKVLNKRTRYLTVLLENIDKPHNASAVIRSCECFGIQDVHLVDDLGTYGVNKKVVMGSSKWICLHKYNQEESNIEVALKELKRKKFRLVATVPNADAVTLENFDLEKGPAAFIFGTELTGVSPTVLDLADEFVHIPMVGFTESLNISVSAAILLQNLTHRLYKSKVSWNLSDLEKKHLLLEWLRKSTPKIESLENRYFNTDKSVV